MKVLGVIPARYGSTRFPGKPLKKILDKPLVQWVIEAAKSSESISEVILATDHEEIMAVGESCGIKSVMTSSDLPSGSDRVWQAVKEMDFDVALNIQGDEPLITGQMLDVLAAPFFNESSLQMATLGKDINIEDLKKPQTAKIVLNQFDEAIYFSRFPVPYSKMDAKLDTAGCLKHIGIYAYSKDFLKTFCSTDAVELEKLEGLEQLRALYLGAQIKVLKVDHESWGVDYPEDVKRVEEVLKSR